jgi:hypothetical protein
MLHSATLTLELSFGAERESNHTYVAVLPGHAHDEAPYLFNSKLGNSRQGGICL